ncbi:MAG: Stk1 family PASTA domain-containing Ser/Thr kinase [Butyricicoccus pullicaecorum]|nr:Stk1 family PASTA domain-containing Ser/Thr kinase [Butyricicoccus pullicaecorum]
MDKYIGTLLGGRYEILEVLGVGGMAMVYKARCRVLNRFVAIKILKEEFAQDEEFRRRFYNESQAVAKLSHNNIVAVYDVAHSDGIDYIVMELIDGISLKEYLQKKGHLSWQETVFFAQQIARALEHAHSRGIIHQDIKPHNIMLLRDGTAKVTDFGIARLESNQETRVMQEAIGSVHYISPEQAKGGAIDSRTDLYSLGVVMYEMLTGKLPFEGDSAVAIVMQHINSVPMMPSELVNGIPKGMDDIVMHAMCPNVSKRYATAQQLYNDLERIKLNQNVAFGYHEHDVRGDAPLLDETRTISYQRGMSSASAGSAVPRFEDDIAPKRQPQRRSNTSPTREDEEYAPRRRRRKKKSFGEKISESPAAMAGVAVAVFAVIAALVGAMLLFSGGSKKIAVPNFLGMDYETVLEKADTDYKDFLIEVADEKKYDPDYREGEVIEQNPKEGSKVAVGSKIILTVCGAEEDSSKGDEKDGYKLIDFSDTKLSEVERLLDQNDIPYTTEEEYDDQIEDGYVIRTNPGEGKTVTKDDTVTIYVSKGKKPETVKMPTLTGKTLDDAKAMLDSYGLTLADTQEEESEEYPVGQVCRQSVSSGTQIKKGASVVLHISTGKKQEQGGDTPSTDPGTSEPRKGTAGVTVTLPDAESSHVKIYDSNGNLLAEKTFAPSGGTQTITVEGPEGDAMLDVWVDGTKTSTPVTFN